MCVITCFVTNYPRAWCPKPSHLLHKNLGQKEPRN
uniref:Uncharacterized protein n=1 Tax=Anguilla anguilla TaxID=7936 RepID=A0A0E9RVS8_ANGAN